MPDENKLKEIANQLRQPQGEKGKEIAHMMDETNRNMTYHAVKHIQIKEGEHLLEIGHGNGGHVCTLLEQNPRTTYYGLDISSLMHEEAKKNNAQQIEEKRASFHLYNGQSIPFEDETFHKIFTVNTLYFWEHPKDFLNELYRILKPNGTLAITYGQKEFMQKLPFTPFNFRLYDNEDVQNLIKETPFKIEGFYTEKEWTKSKTGEKVEREFTTVVIKKEEK